MIIDCPYTTKPCSKNKCPYQVKVVIPYISEENGETESIIIAGFCSATSDREEIAEGYCTYE